MSATKRSITTLVVLASLALTSCAQETVTRNGGAPSTLSAAIPSSSLTSSSALHPNAPAGNAGTPGAYVTVTTTPHAKAGEAPAAIAAESFAKSDALIKTIRTRLNSNVIVSASVSVAPAFANPSTNWFYAT